MRNRTKRILHLILFSFLLFLDQITKFLARNFLQGKGSTIVIPKLFSFTYLENTGAIWGVFKDKTVFLIISTVIAFFLILYIYFKIPMEKRYLPIRLIFVFVAAGALGNIIDRISFGYVTDFIQFEFIDFPIFNVADIYITVSAFSLMFLTLFFYKDEPKSEMEQGDEPEIGLEQGNEPENGMEQGDGSENEPEQGDEQVNGIGQGEK